MTVRSNKIIAVGLAGRDMEVRYSQSGSAIGRFTIASSHGKKQQDGSYLNETIWFSVTLFGDMAEEWANKISKGQKVQVEGRLTVNEYETKTGIKRADLNIIADDIILTDKYAKKGSGGYQNAPKEYAKEESSFESPSESDDLSDDIPF